MSAAETLGKYEIRRQLGRGATGTVYEGWDPVIKRRVAIKIVHMPTTDDGDTGYEISRFRREAEAAGRLNHPNIVGVFDYGETADVAYIVMEYVDGPTLKAVLDNNKSFPLPRFGEIMEGVLAGLQYSHERGVVHRDIKPANLMLSAAGETKIADFGIARIDSSSMTQAGTVLGTPAYMSPEQFLGQVVDARSDIYSAGALLYQLLTGERPFEGSMSSIMHKALYTEALPPSHVSVSAPQQFDAVIRRALAKRPEDRFPSAKDFAAAIRASVAAPPGTRQVEPEDATIIAAPRKPAPGSGVVPKAAAAVQPVPTRAAALASAEPVQSSRAETGPGAIVRSKAAFPSFGVIGAAIVGLTALAGVGYFLLPRSSTILIPPRDQVVQTTVPAVPAPAPVVIPAPANPPVPSQPAPVAPQVDALLPPTAAMLPPITPSVIAAPPASAPNSLEQATAAARLVPCSALNVTSVPDGLRIAGFARGGPDLDRLIAQIGEAGRLTNDVTATEPFACAPIEAAARYIQQPRDGRPVISVKPDQREPASGTRFQIDVDTTLPALYVDLYQSDGLVRHVMRPAPGVQNNIHTGSMIAPSAGPGLIMAIGAAKPLDLGTRPEAESASDYLAVLKPGLANPAASPAVDLAMVTVRPPDPVAPKTRPIEPAAAKPVAPPVPRPRPTEPAVAKMPPPRAPSLRSGRCSNIVSRAQLGETLSDGELMALRTECRS
jgi:serine/threonine-protein kinase